MMMLFLLAVAAQSPTQPPKIVILAERSSSNASCPIANAHLTSGRIDGTTSRGFHTLDKEPGPQAYLTVARKIEGCDVPMVVPSVMTAGR